MCLLCGVVKLINKIVNKFLALIALFSTACLAGHAFPIHFFESVLSSKPLYEVPVCFLIAQIIIFLALSVASFLLLLELFSVNIKLVQYKVWIVFAGVGVLPFVPPAAMGAFMLPIAVIATIGELLGFC